MPRLPKPASFGPERVLYQLDETFCPWANHPASDAELLSWLAAAATEQAYKAYGVLGRFERGMVRLRATGAEETINDLDDAFRNNGWTAAAWAGKFTAALLLRGFDAAVLTEEEPRGAAWEAAVEAIGAALEAAGKPDEFASEDEIR